MKRVVSIGGGSGQFVLLSGLRELPDIGITSIVSMVDSGGSTGRLRDELGVLPPGDILKCITALAEDPQATRRILLARFQANPRLRGHNAGNLLLTFLSQYAGCFAEGVAALGEVLGVCGTILPVTIDRATLVAELTDGTQVFGEAAIDVPRGNQRERIRRTFLVPHHCDAVRVFPPVLEALAAADFIVVGPGDLYTSIIPNLIVPGVKEAIAAASARVIYNCNIMTKFGETHRFAAEDFVLEIEEHIGRAVDVVTLNDRQPTPGMLARYQDEKAHVVSLHDDSRIAGRILLHADLLDDTGEVARHDARKLATVLNRVFTGQAGAPS